MPVAHQWGLEDLLANQAGCGAPALRLFSLSTEAQARCESRVRERLLALSSAELTHRAEVLFAAAQRPV